MVVVGVGRGSLGALGKPDWGSLTTCMSWVTGSHVKWLLGTTLTSQLHLPDLFPGVLGDQVFMSTDYRYGSLIHSCNLSVVLTFFYRNN